MFRFHFAAASLALAFPAAASTIVPAQPAAQQAVDLRLTVDSCTFNPATVQVAASGSTLRVTQRLNNCLVPGTPKLYDVRLGNFPAGDYRVEVYGTATVAGAPAESIGFTVSPRADIAVFPPPVHPLTNYSGFWFDPTQPGWGLALAQDPVSDTLFGAWFEYDGTHAPYWTTLQNGQWTTPTSWKGSDYLSNGYAPESGVRIPPTYVSANPIALDFESVPVDGTLRMSLVIGTSAIYSYRLQRFQP